MAFTARLVAALLALVSIACAQPSLAVECPTGLCGATCGAAITDATLQRTDVKLPCDNGLDGVIAFLGACMKSQTGFDWDDCDGRTTELIAEGASLIQCVEGGTLKDKIEGGGGESDDTKEPGEDEQMKNPDEDSEDVTMEEPEADSEDVN